MAKSRRAVASPRRASKDETKAVSDRPQTGGRKKPASGGAVASLDGSTQHEGGKPRVSVRAKARSPRRADASALSRAGHAQTEKISLLTSDPSGRRLPQNALRPALLAGAAACALTLAAAPSPAQAQTATPRGLCMVFATGTVECSGDSTNGNLSGGVSITTTNKKVDDAIITDPRAAITPSSGTDGVFFSNAFGGNSTLKVDVDGAGGNGFDITSNNAHGVYGAMSADGNLTINTYGDIRVQSGADKFAITGRQTTDGDISITSEGAIQSTYSGIYAYSSGYGDASINSDGAVTAAADGLYARVKYGVASVVSEGTITALTGIRAFSEEELGPPADPPGDRTVVSVRSKSDITVTGTSQGVAGYGVHAQSTTSGDVFVYSDGDITAVAGSFAVDGVFARAGSNQEGNDKSVGNIEIISKGDIDVTRNGIDAEATVPSGQTPGAAGAVSGDVDITSEGAVSTDTGAAIRGYAQGGDVTIKSTGDVSSVSGHGIWAKANGASGFARVESTANISGRIGIHAYSAAKLGPPANPPLDPPEDRNVVWVKSTGADITVTGTTPALDGFGVYAQSKYSGDVYIYSTSDITAVAGSYNVDGIFARAGSRDDAGATVGGATVVGNIEIISKGDIDVTRNGIDAETTIPSGRTVGGTSVVSGAIDITVTGDVSTDTGAAIRAYAQGGDVTIYSGQSTNVTSDSGDTIWAKTNGAGVTDIDSYANLYAGNRGIYASSYDVDIISDSNIESGGTGIEVDAYEVVKINSGGDIDAGGSAIDAYSETGDIEIYSGGVLESSVEGGAAIRAFSNGGSLVQVESRGSVTADNTNGTGIYAALAGTSDGNDEVRILSYAAVTSGRTGIYGRVLDGDGDVYIKSTAAVSASNGVTNGGAGGYAIRGAAEDGDVTIYATGAVSSISSYHAISGYSKTGDVTIDVSVDTSGEVYSRGSHGVFAHAAGSGQAYVNLAADVTSRDSDAIVVTSETGFADASVTGNITASGVGVDVDGQRARVYVDGVITTSSTTAVSHGITARSSNGPVDLYFEGTISAEGAAPTIGIEAISTEGGNVTVESEGAVSGNRAGIYAAVVEGDGAVTITSIGQVSSLDSTVSGVNGDLYGIFATAYNGNTTISSEGVVSGGRAGIYAYSEYGVVSVESDGTVTASGSEGVGIEVYSYYGDAKVVSTGDVTGGWSAVLAKTNEGEVYVSSSGAVVASGDGGYGVFAAAIERTVVKSIGPITANGASATGIIAYSTTNDVEIVSSGGVSAGGTGIRGNAGTESGGDLTINSTGNVTGAAGYGIDAEAKRGDVTVTSEGDVTGGIVAIFAHVHEGVGYGGEPGDIVINSIGDLTMTGAPADDDAPVSAAINAANTTTGAVSIESNGAIVASGADARGVIARGLGQVTVKTTGSITASDAGAGGIDATSTGGDVEIVSNGAVSAGETGVSGVAGSASGGNLTINSTGAVTGVAGYGIFAKATDGDVAVTSAGVVTGAKAAIAAIVDSGGGDTGDISIVSNGDLTSTGADGDGVRVRSAFADSSNLIVISTGNTVTGGSGDGAGVRFTGGGTNRLENSGAISAASGVAVVGGDGDEEIINTGTLTGAVMLGAGNDRVEISGPSDISDASFDGGEGSADVFRLAVDSDGALTDDVISNFEVFEKTGSGTWSFTGEHVFATSVSLAGGVLDLQGTLSSPIVTNSGGSLTVGGVGVIGAGTIDGDYVQEAGGDLLFDLDFASGESDLLTITGEAALAGTITPADVNVTSQNQVITFLTATGGVTNNGFTLNDFSSPVIGAELIFPNANDIAISVNIGFTPPNVTLTGDQAALATVLEGVFNAGGADGALSDVFDALFFNVDGEAAYVDALNQLSPEPFLSAQTASVNNAVSFSNEMFSCADKTDASTRSREGECLWLRVSGGALDVDSDGGTIGFEENTVGVTAGWQFEVAEDLQIGLAGGFEKVEIDTDAGARSEGDRLMGGISVKHQRGPLQIAAALSGGVADYETTRTISFGGFSDTLLSSQDVAHAAAELRVAYQFDFDRWYAKPFVDGNATWVDLGDVTESGGAAALVVEGKDARFYSVTPGLELGAELDLTESLALKPYLRAGPTFVDNPALALNAGFVEAPAGAGAFVESVTIDDQYLDVEAGVTLFKLGGGSQRAGRFGELGSRAAISFVYEGRHGENTKQNSAFIKAAFPF